MELLVTTLYNVTKYTFSRKNFINHGIYCEQLESKTFN